LAVGGVTVEVQGEAAEDLVHRVLAVVADDADLAAAGVLQHQALEQVVDVAGGERQLDAGIAGDVALALEVADAAVEEDDLRDRQGSGGFNGGGGVRGRGWRGGPA